MRVGALVAAALLLALDAAAGTAGYDVVLLVDRSASMAANAARTRAVVELAFGMIARNGRSNRVEHHVAVMDFDAAACLDPAFAAAADRFDSSDPLRRRAVVIVTDGLGCAPNDNLAPPADVVAVLLFPPARNRDAWRKLSRDHLYEIEGSGADDVLATARSAFARLVGTRAVEVLHDSLLLPPYLELVVFDVFRGDNAVVSAFPPGSARPLTAANDGVEELAVGDTFSTLIVRHPEPGCWTFRKSRPSARVRIFSEQFFPRGTLVTPPPGQPIRQYDRVSIAYRLADENGQPVAELSAYPLTVELALVKPRGGRAALPLVREASATYRAGASVECDDAGRYWTDVRIASRDLEANPVEIFRDQWSGFSVDAVMRTAAESPAPGQVRVATAAAMSVADRLGLPKEFVTALLMLAIVLTLVPYFSGLAAGPLVVPKLDRRKQRMLRVAGPVALAAAVALVVPLSALAPPATKVQLLAADFLDGRIDAAVANTGSTAALITRIELEVVAEHEISARPVLDVAGLYRIPIGDLHAGQRRGIAVRHLIPAAATERIAITPATVRAMDVRLRMAFADGTVLNANVPLHPNGETYRSTAAGPPIR